MSRLGSTRLVAPAIGLVVVLAACSGTEGSAADQDQSTTSAAPTTTTTAATDPAAPGSPSTTAAADEPTPAPSLIEAREDLGIAALVLEPTTETGNHPTISWQPVDGAASYWLVVRDADGSPYWAWTGNDTSVRVGGGDSPDTNQTAVLHETMTWSVAAFSDEGKLVALSDQASLSP